MFVTLKPLAQRAISADGVVARLRGKLAQAVAGASLFLVPVAGHPRRRPAEPSAQYQYTLQADDLDRAALVGAAHPLRAVAASRACRRQHRRAGQGRADDADDRPRRSRAARPVAERTIDTTLNDAFGQRQVSTIYNPLNQYQRGDGSRAGILAKPRGAEGRLRAHGGGRRGAADGVRALRSRRTRRSPSTTRDSSRRRRSPSTCPRERRCRRRKRRSTTRSRSWVFPTRCTARSRARRARSSRGSRASRG